MCRSRLVTISFMRAVLVVLAACSSKGTPEAAGDTAGVSGGAAAAGGLGASGVNGAAGGAGSAGVAAGTGGVAGSSVQGSAGEGGAGASAGSGGSSGAGGSAGEAASELEPFSFFVTSYAAMARLANNPAGFGGDLRHGEADGLSGADKICTEIAETSMPGSAAKVWRAFLSAKSGPGGAVVNAISRIGEGPWYDRNGRLLAQTKADLLHERPNADPIIKDDLPNEDGVLNHDPDGTGQVDNHHVLTGSDANGNLYMNSASSTCADWTSATKTSGVRPRVGFMWPHDTRVNWISGQDEGGCLPGTNFVETGGSNETVGTVGSGGGYGAIYCFALAP